MTTQIHWLRGTTDQDVNSVIHSVANLLGESVTVRDRAAYGYSEAFMVGPVAVLHHSERPDMGVCLDIPGQGCEELGAHRLAALWRGLGLKATRLDLAVDHCNFTPSMLHDAWTAGNVRSRSKIPADARADRQWRKCEFSSKPIGDKFTMGSRTSSQFARCYDSRGFTRFELELKADAAQAAAVQVFEAVQNPEAFSLVVLSWVRRFVDFVDADSAVHPSRRTLLPFWEAFCGAVPKARAVLQAFVGRSIEEVRAWVAHQVAPSLALVADVIGWQELRRIAKDGRSRWSNRHLEIRRVGRLAMTQ